MIVPQSEYNNIKSRFLRKHGGVDYVSDTGMREDDSYGKLYVCEDGSQLTECFRPVYLDFENAQTGLTASIKCFESEQWNTDDANSVFCYDLYDNTKRGIYN